METETEEQQRNCEEESVYLPRTNLYPQSPIKSSWGLDWDQEAFLQETWGEGLEV